MKKIIVIVTNLDEKTSNVVFDNNVNDEAIRVIYHEDDGAVNEIKFQEENVIEIKRFKPGLKSKIYLSKEKSYAKVKTDEGCIEIPITLKNITWTNKEINATYFTGENFKITIEFKEENK